MSKSNQIIFEVGDEFGLTREQSKELWDQYWNDFVLRKMHEFNHLSVKVIGLGSFFLKKRKTEKRIETIKDILETKEDTPYRDRLIEEMAKKERLVNALIERNSKFKKKRNYG